MLGFHVGQEDRVEPPHPRGPNRLERFHPRPGVEQNGAVCPAFADEIRVGHADAVRHPQGPHAKRQYPNLRGRIAPGAQGAQPDLVQPEDPGKPTQFGAIEVGAVIQSVAQPADRDVRAAGQRFHGPAGATQGFFQHVAHLILQLQCRRFDHEIRVYAGSPPTSKIDFVFWRASRSVAGMDSRQQEILDIFTRTRALLQGHFVLRSGLHSGHYFQCAQVCQRMDAVERLGELLLEKVRGQGLRFETVLAPAMGGLVIGQEVARRAQARYIFAEKENNVLVLRRGFTLRPGEPVLIVEDVVTRGGRVLECLDIVRKAGGQPVGIAMLVDRSAGTARFDVPAVSLLELSFPTYPADAVPETLARIPVEKPGS
jgi:orotate phosphoribosyltransferase